MSFIIERLRPIPTSYEVSDGDDVVLDVVVGEQQLGTITVTLDGVELASQEGSINLAIGKGADVVGKRLRVSTTVTLTNPRSNVTIVTYRLDGAARALERETSNGTGQRNQNVFHDAQFLFVSAP